MVKKLGSIVLALAVMAVTAQGAIAEKVVGVPAPGKVGRCPDKKPWTDEVVAKSLNVPVARLKALKAARSLSNRQICTFPEPMLKRAWSKLETGKAGYPNEWAEFRNLQRRSDDGIVKPDGLIRGFEHRKAVLKAIKEKAAKAASRDHAETAYNAQESQSTLLEAGAAAIDIPSAGVDTSVAGIASNQWTEIGPGNIGGRIRAILIDPDNTNNIWVGGVAGGIFHSTDHGASFSPVNDFMANLSISSLVMDPSNHNTIYAGTGEGFFNLDGVRGYGVFKSTDRGSTWTFLTATTPSTSTSNAAYAWYYVTRLAISRDGATLLAATKGYYGNSGGIWRSTNGGASWSQRYSTGRVMDVRFDPNDANNAIAHSVTYNSGQWESNIIKSTNGGQSWTVQKTFSNSSSRIELAYATSNSQIIYASVDQNSGEIWKSTDGGTTWGSARVANPQHLGNQGWYDNAIWVDPTNGNHMVAAGLDVYRSTDGGTSWTKISNWGNNQIDIRYGSGVSHTPHADHHALVSDPGYNGTTNRIVYNGNDGGLYRAADITLAGQTSGWDELNNGIGLTQFYSVAGKTAAGTRIIGGAQDNGMLYNGGPGTDWKMFNGGDGGYCAVDATNDNYLYGEYVYLQIGRSTDRGSSFSYIDKTGSSQLTDARTSSGANFIAPFILDPNDSNRMLAGGLSLWQNNAVRTGTDWTAIKTSTGQQISAIAVAEGNSDITWVGHNTGGVYQTANSRNASPTWTQVTIGPSRMVMRILIDKDNPNIVYVAFGGYNSDNLYKTTDNGSTWTNLNASNVLPAVPFLSVTRHPSNANWLYVGTEVGLFTSQDGGSTWSTSNDGPANVEIVELIWRDDTTLIAATHGRGMFTATVLAKPVTSTTVSSNLNPSTYGQSVTYTASVTPSNATGTVTFKDGTTMLGTGTLSGGSATFTTSALTAGSHSITAAYGGDNTYSGSTSGPLAQTVDKATTTVSAWPNASTISYSQALSSSTLSGGTASVPGSFAFSSPTTIPAAGSYSAAVGFNPTDPNYASVSGTVAVPVTMAPLTITAAAQHKAVGGPEPTFTYAATGFVNGETMTIMTGSLSRAAGEALGTYPIQLGTLSAGSNYTISYLGANLSIMPAIARTVISGQNGVPYAVVADALATMTPGATVSLLLVGGDISESITYTTSATLNLAGGYNADFSQQDGSVTTFHGSLTISGGPVTVENLAVM